MKKSSRANPLSLGFLVGGVLCSLTTVLAWADDAQEKAIEKEQKLFEGTWRIVTLEIDGNKSSEDDAKKLHVINGPDGTWSLHDESKPVSKGTSSIDPAKKPKTIDFTATEGDDKGKKYLGIYEIGEKTRKLCFVPAGVTRPTEFSTSPGSQRILVTYQREKK